MTLHSACLWTKGFRIPSAATADGSIWGFNPTCQASRMRFACCRHHTRGIPGQRVDIVNLLLLYLHVQWDERNSPEFRTSFVYYSLPIVHWHMGSLLQSQGQSLQMNLKLPLPQGWNGHLGLFPLPVPCQPFRHVCFNERDALQNRGAKDWSTLTTWLWNNW